MSTAGFAGRDGRLMRARALLERYGADRARWPENERALFDKFEGDYRFETFRRQERALDDALDAAKAPAAPSALKDAILAAYAPPPRAGRPSFSFGGRLRRLVPAGALAGLSALGFAVGAATASSGAQEYEAVYYSQTTFAFVDEGDALWAEE